MGVQGLWQLISPAGKKIDPQTLRGKRLAIDVSIWVLKIIYGFLAKPGADQQAFNSIHLIMIFKRLISLLQLGIKPVFVFDGKPPDLKRQTLLLRQEIRDKREKNLKKLAERYLVKKLENKLTGQEIQTGLNQKQIQQYEKEKQQEKEEQEEIEALIEGLNKEDKTDFDLKLEEHQHAILDTEFNQLVQQHPTMLDDLGYTREEFLMSKINEKNNILKVMFQQDKQIKQGGFENVDNIHDYSKLQASQYIQYCINRQELFKIREKNYKNLNNLQIQILEEKEKENESVLKSYLNQPGAKITQGDIKSSRDQFFLMVGQQQNQEQQEQIKPIQKYNIMKAPTSKNQKFQQMNQKLGNLLQDRHKEYLNLMNYEQNQLEQQQKEKENTLFFEIDQKKNNDYNQKDEENNTVKVKTDKLITCTDDLLSDFFGDEDDSEEYSESKNNDYSRKYQFIQRNLRQN